MDQLFVIQRYKPPETEKSEEYKKKQYIAALDSLLEQARKRQQLQAGTVIKDPKTESPRAVIKRKLFQSPSTQKSLKKTRTAPEELVSEQNIANTSHKISKEPIDVCSTGKAEDDEIECSETKKKKKLKKERIRKDIENQEVLDQFQKAEIVPVFENILTKDSSPNEAQASICKPKKRFKLFRNKNNEIVKEKGKFHEDNGYTEEIRKEMSNENDSVQNNLKIYENDLEEEGEKSLLKPEGFTIIGEVLKKSTEPVARVLPNWLAQPTVISSNLQDKKVPVNEMTILDPSLLTVLKENAVSHFFPVQHEVIPWLVKSFSTDVFFRPQDICVSAPTGSGKTLSYVLPIIHAIMNRLVPVVRVLVILPVKDLALQVFKVFQCYTKSTNLKIALISGHKPHTVEARKLVRPNVKGGFSSLVDIVIATPGSLMHHIQRTEGFSLHNLRFLVIDEADRLIEDVQEGWLATVEKAIQSKKMHSCQCRSKPNSGRMLSGSIIACCLKRPVQPCQKLLFSATLSHDPEKLKTLSLFCPKLFTTVASSKSYVDYKEDVVEKFSTPQELTEQTIMCEPQMKPLTLWYLLRKKHYSRVLCFTNTVESSRRLTLLLSELGDINVCELSSNLRDQQRKSILNQFASGKIDILVCSDMMARGMDLDNVQCVICYDPPLYIKTYIHRIGRTARAGLSGIALSLLYKGEYKQFNKLMKLGSRPAVEMLPFDGSLLNSFQEHYENSLETVSSLIVEQEQKLKLSRNIFQKSRKNRKEVY